MIQRRKLKFDQCFNGQFKGVYFKINKILDVAFYEKDINRLEKSLDMMLRLGYITITKYHLIIDDIVAFRSVMNQTKTLTDGSIR